MNKTKIEIFVTKKRNAIRSELFWLKYGSNQFVYLTADRCNYNF